MAASSGTGTGGSRGEAGGKGEPGGTEVRAAAVRRRGETIILGAPAQISELKFTSEQDGNCITFYDLTSEHTITSVTFYRLKQSQAWPDS
ncbi:unnamed protein product [Rangifer tarandus platyrhynchus]|uniref:Uncharacterized protein n=2 Tax=Rangifer tarandus platyrhynchus TaxID=3082113 RepID=A0AC60A3I1_RANTA|nr:unnamed protein product [Rangifer tarandus platyrhynchus]